MMQLITGYWLSQAVGVAARLGVADELVAGPRSSDDLARAVGARPQALYRLLRLLASIGVFRQEAPGRFALAPLGETLRSDAPDSVRNFAITETAFGHWQPWGRLLDSVRTGRPMAQETLGGELFDWYGQHPDEAAFFTAAMGNLSALAAGELVRVYDVSAARTVVEGLIWPFSLAFGRTPPSVALERMTTGRVTQALVVAVAVVPRSAAESHGTVPSAPRPRPFGI